MVSIVAQLKKKRIGVGPMPFSQQVFSRSYHAQMSGLARALKQTGLANVFLLQRLNFNGHFFSFFAKGASLFPGSNTCTNKG